MADEIVHRVTVSLKRQFEFAAEFENLPEVKPIHLDEPPPLGTGHGPTAVALLGAAVGNCLAASLKLCLQKARAQTSGLVAQVTAHVKRNEAGRYRVAEIEVELSPEISGEDLGRLTRCEWLFEDFCIVTESVRHGIPVSVRVHAKAEHGWESHAGVEP